MWTVIDSERFATALPAISRYPSASYEGCAPLEHRASDNDKSAVNHARDLPTAPGNMPRFGLADFAGDSDGLGIQIALCSNEGRQLGTAYWTTEVIEETRRKLGVIIVTLSWSPTAAVRAAGQLP